MKAVKKHFCPICYTGYGSERRAKKCEHNHKKVRELVSVCYASINEDLTGYPMEIDVKCEDGTEATYNRLLGSETR